MIFGSSLLDSSMRRSSLASFQYFLTPSPSEWVIVLVTLLKLRPNTLMHIMQAIKGLSLVSLIAPTNHSSAVLPHSQYQKPGWPLHRRDPPVQKFPTCFTPSPIHLPCGKIPETLSGGVNPHLTALLVLPTVRVFLAVSKTDYQAGGIGYRRFGSLSDLTTRITRSAPIYDSTTQRPLLLLN